jgi:Mg-chelatase subunit ChlD
MKSDQAADADLSFRWFEYDDGLTLAADVGASETARVDVVDETLIVVTDGEQYEQSIPGDAEAFINNGVLTVDLATEDSL